MGLLSFKLCYNTLTEPYLTTKHLWGIVILISMNIVYHIFFFQNMGQKWSQYSPEPGILARTGGCIQAESSSVNTKPNQTSIEDKMGLANMNTVLGQRAGVLNLVLQKVFGQLSPQDMKSVVLVCWEWKEVGEEPQFWTWLSPAVLQENLATRLKLLGSRRLQGELEVWGKCRFDNNILTHQQAMAVFTAISGATKLRKLNMKDCSFSISLDLDHLATTLNKLEELTLSEIKGLQINAIMTTLASGRSQLKSLNISKTDLSLVTPGVLAQALNNLEEFSMGWTKMTKEQIVALLIGKQEEESKLKKLSVTMFENLVTVDPDLVARAVTKLESARLFHTKMTKQQLKQIFTLINTNDSKLKALGLHQGSFWHQHARSSPFCQQTRAHTYLMQSFDLLNM